jgi:hypothetical protein
VLTPPTLRPPLSLLLALLAAAASAQVAPADTAAADSAGLAPEGPYEPLPPALAGVVWAAPDDPAAALDDLLAMRRAGVRAVRTGLVEDERVLEGAGLLGVRLFQELPVEGLPARFLVDETDRAAALLGQALERARPYPAARHFGLARASDTSDRRTRPYFEALTDLARERGAPGTRTYYVSRFPRSDRAAEAVDFVLLDARDADPTAVLETWRARHETPAGLAAVGTGVRPGRDGGWRTPGTPAAQARTLEDAFGALLALEDPPVATFVSRWRDVPAGAERDQRTEVAGTRFGLRDGAGERRPAFSVAEGFWTGRQRVFAFDAGAPPGRERLGAPLLLLGWALVLGLGVFYVSAPRLGSMAPRYFGRRDLYRDAVKRGFDLTAVETAGLAAALAVAVGVVVTAALRALARTDTLAVATAAWSFGAQERLTWLLGRPFLLVGVLALGYGLWLVATLLWLKALAGRRRLRPSQALSLVVWCRWAWLPLMVVALVLGGVDARLATLLAPAVLVLGLAIEVVAGFRMTTDLQAVTNTPPLRAVVLGFGLPFVLAAAGLVVVGVASRDEVGFLWHLATRS